MTAFTDGVLVLRWLFGIRGTALVDGVVDADCTVCSPAQIEAELAALEPLLDVDLDGWRQPLTDGLLILRFLLGGGGDLTIEGAVGDGCARCDAQSLSDYLESLS